MDPERIIAAAFILVGVLIWLAVRAWDRYKFVTANAPTIVILIAADDLTAPGVSDVRGTERGARILDLIAANEAARIDEEWRRVGGAS